MENGALGVGHYLPYDYFDLFTFWKSTRYTSSVWKNFCYELDTGSIHGFLCHAVPVKTI
jgi:hypothetical protein